jgi:hypothetical protein
MTSDSKTVRERIRDWVDTAAHGAMTVKILDDPYEVQWPCFASEWLAERIEAALHMTAWSMVHYRSSRDSRTYIPADWIKHGIEAGIAELERDRDG